MPSSYFSSDSSGANSGAAPGPMVPPGRWQTYRQQQQQPNQGPAGSAPPATDSDLLDSDGAADAGLDAAEGDDTFDLSLPQDPGASGTGSSDNDAPPAATSSAEPLRAERRRSNQLEKELRKARAQLSRFSEINPDEYARLQDAERKREEFERQVGDRERQLNEANQKRMSLDSRRGPAG